jgi:hypothetical protein
MRQAFAPLALRLTLWFFVLAIAPLVTPALILADTPAAQLLYD